MAKRFRPGDVKWVAYPDGYARVEILERGTGGRVFRDGRKPEHPYVVDQDGEEYVLGEDQLHDDPIAASRAVAEMRNELGLEEFEENEEEEYEENDGGLFDNPDEEDEEFDDEDEED
jgi:hypothetical protein